MKLRAIRLREAGGFRDGQALEGLSGQLDVFAAPNEIGKSTILQGLRALFFMPHASVDTKATSPLARLKPLAGGAPLIEADFEVEGGLWRLRKQFFSAKQAVLSNLDKGDVVARGRQADQKVLQMLRGVPGVDERLALLWVGQQDTLQDFSLSSGAQTSLRGLIEGQVQDVVSTGQARAVRQQIAQRLDKMVTDGWRKKKNSWRPRKNTAFDNALAREAQLTEDLAVAKAQAGEAAERLAQLQNLTKQQKELSSASAVKARADKVEHARKAHQRARQAREQLRHARLLLQNCLGEQQQASKELQDFDANLHKVQKLEAQIENAKPAIEELQKKLENTDARRSETRHAIGERQQTLLEFEQRLKALTQAQRRHQAQHKLDKINQALDEARQAEANMRAASEALGKNAITGGRVQKLRSLASAIAEIEAQLAAASAKVTIDYDKGVRGRIKLAGEAVADGARFEVDRLLILDIEGIGRISIAPGVDSQSVDLHEDAAALREELADMLALTGAADLAAAEKGLEARAELEAQVAGARTKLDTLAPAGVDVLEKEARMLAENIGEGPVEQDRANDQTSAENLSQRADSLRAELKELEQKSEVLGQASRSLSTNLAEQTASLKAHQTQLLELVKKLPAADQRQAHRDALAATVTKAELAASAAQTALHDWEDKAGDDASFDALAQRLEQAIAARDKADQEVNTLARDISQLKGALSGSAQDGIEARVSELEGQLVLAAEKSQRFRDDIDALLLLDDVLEKAERATVDRFLLPVMKAIAPYLERVLPGAVLSMTDDFAIASMMRDGNAEPLNILSDGTREQIAVLVRLGFARLLAQNGTAVPLILDDALVYSDDQRVIRAFSALRDAAKLHQIIVLTCRTTSFAALEGHRLELVSWNPRDTEI